MGFKLSNKHSSFEKIILPLNKSNKKKIISDEIYINGLMYDIKSYSFVDNKIELIVICDTEETSILASIKDFLNVANSQDMKLGLHLMKILTMIYLSVNFMNPFKFSNMNSFYFHQFSFCFISIIPNSIFYPPEFN